MSIRIIQFIMLFSIIFLGAITPAFCQDVPVCSITVKIEHGKKGELLSLQQYNCRVLSTIDSLTIDTGKELMFHRDKSLPSGMYALSLNKTLLANFFISDKSKQRFTISLDALNPAQTLTFTGSPENQAFVGYLRFLGTRQHTLAEINQEGEHMQKKYPGSMLALFIQTMKEPEIPEPVIPVSDPIECKYGYLVNHFFDNVNFSDKRLLNTPLLEQKLGFYFKQMVPPLPDSITERVDQVLQKAKADHNVYNWTVLYLYNLYHEAPIEGNNEIYNYIGENFILTEPNRWSDKAFVEKVRNRVAKARLNPIGEIATNLWLQSPEGKKVDLYSIKATYTVLFFYNPECEACQPVSAELSEFSKQNRAKGVEVFAVYMDQKKEVWKSAIAEKGQSWINVFDPKGPSEIEEKYDLFALPMIYLLDKNKKVIAKDVTVEKLKKWVK